MAKKVESFKVNNAKKTIVLYTNVEQNPAEKSLIEFYLLQGYTPKTEEKKKGISVAEMRKELEVDSETLAKFNEAYSTKADKKSDKDSGFHKACKIYTEWKKNH